MIPSVNKILISFFSNFELSLCDYPSFLFRHLRSKTRIIDAIPFADRKLKIKLIAKYEQKIK